MEWIMIGVFDDGNAPSLGGDFFLPPSVLRFLFTKFKKRILRPNRRGHFHVERAMFAETKMAIESVVLLSKKATAHMLSVSLRMVDYLVKGGELPSRRIGRRVLIPRKAIERFAERNRSPRPEKSGGLISNAGGKP
jgi:excisionase family DNA binding protein